MDSQEINNEIRKITNLTSVQKMLRTRQLSNFGHICRMKESRLRKFIMKCQVGSGINKTTRNTKTKMVRFDKKRLIRFRLRYQHCKRKC